MDPRPRSQWEGYSTPEACAAAGITYRMADYWARTGILAPSLRAARGSGTQRRYSHGDVLGLAIIAELLDAGLSLQSVRRSIDNLRGISPDDLDGRNLTITANGAAFLTAPELVDLLATGGVFHVLPLAGVVDRVDEHLAGCAAAREVRAWRAGRLDTRHPLVLCSTVGA